MKLPKKSWVSIKLSKLERKILLRLFKLYTISYKEIGLSIDSISKLKEKYKITMLIDIDKDPEPDAFIIYRITKYGNKLALMGSDGTRKSKDVLISKSIKLLKSRYWYAEGSHAVAHLFKKNNIKPITKQKDVEIILKGKNIVWLNDNGKYRRKIHGLKKPVVKQLFGKYKIK